MKYYCTLIGKQLEINPKHHCIAWGEGRRARIRPHCIEPEGTEHSPGICLHLRIVGMPTDMPTEDIREYVRVRLSN